MLPLPYKLVSLEGLRAICESENRQLIAAIYPVSKAYDSHNRPYSVTVVYYDGMLVVNVESNHRAGLHYIWPANTEPTEAIRNVVTGLQLTLIP